MARLRALNAWFDRVPWYLDATVCALPAVLVMTAGSVALHWNFDLRALLVPVAAVFVGRYFRHRRLGSSNVP